MSDPTPSPRPTVFLLAGLGLSGLVYDSVIAELGDDFDSVTIDLPGFGGVNTETGVTVDDYVNHVIRRIRRHGSTRWLLVGHSMGGKVASLVAARVLAGEPGLFGLSGVVLLAGSPPSPEPMADDRREDMISWAQHGPLDEAAARAFVDGNVGAPLSSHDDALVMADLQRTAPEAWLAWLERGSRDDRVDEVGVLDLPALIVAGGADADLGAGAQPHLNGPVYPRARFETLAGAGHLLMLERTHEVADAIRTFWHDRAGIGPVVPDDVAGTIASGRTSSRTRGILARRAVADDADYRPRVLSPEQLATLRILASRSVPQEGPAIDLAARVDAGLVDGASDGWRNAALPPDDVAYQRGLDDLGDFGVLSEAQQDERLAAIVAGEWAKPGGEFTAKQMNLWFEDARVDMIRLWLGHPATMARIGFDGFANGGDLVRIQGFLRLGAGQKEGWEPRMAAAGAGTGSASASASGSASGTGTGTASSVPSPTNTTDTTTDTVETR